MDIWKFYDITHRYHRFCNPMTEEKLDEERVSRSRESYLRWGRDCLGWAIYLFRK